jgi:hypothetical protein
MHRYRTTTYETINEEDTRMNPFIRMINQHKIDIPNYDITTTKSIHQTQGLQPDKGRVSPQPKHPL